MNLMDRPIALVAALQVALLFHLVKRTAPESAACIGLSLFRKDTLSVLRS